MENQTITLPVVTSDGDFMARYSDNGLASLNFPSKRTGGKNFPKGAASPRIRDWHDLTTRAVTAVLAGREARAWPPLDLSGGTEFQRAVWSAMQKIRSGQTRSYGEIARAIGKPNAVRAVGGACGANPIPVLVPCHRVLAANRKLGGFSGGLEWKRRLLEREGVRLQ